MMRTRTGIVIGTLLLATLGGCVRPLVPGSGRVFPPNDVLPPHPGSTVGRPDSASSIRSGFSRKLVSGKQSPSLLIARDGSRCTVSEKRFADTKEGEQVWCAWTDGG
jgi:hypothetical protein